MFVYFSLKILRIVLENYGPSSPFCWKKREKERESLGTNVEKQKLNLGVFLNFSKFFKKQMWIKRFYKMLQQELGKN